ncbi:MAG: hypothetical protein BWK74_04415 [Desulfobacteraceae bacterium A6]|nr:MAG: hypothetical protein BWK74_04415 [Desulfobacteraceae bacterium A6]
MVFDYFTSSDNVSIRYGILDCGAKTKKGSIILLGGRKEFMEKYAETIEELKQRQFDVYSMDWRGQGLSSRLLANRHKGHINDYSEYIEDLNYFVNNIVKPGAVSPLIILGHSMGGHVALRFLHDFPEAADKAVLTSPMIDINIPSFPRWLVRFFAFCAAGAGFGHSYSVGSKGYSASNIKFEGNTLTSDPVRFMDEHRAIAESSELALGGVTYGWLAATFKSIDILSCAEYAGKIKTPVLIISAGKDRIVSQAAQREICSIMGKGAFVCIPDSFHEILKERDTVRKTFWKEFDEFAES